MKTRPQKNQKIKFVVAVALGGILVLVGIWQGIVQPILKARSEQAARLEELQDKLQEVTRQLRQAVDDRQKNMENLIQILDISDRYILHPSLGNYLITATSILEKHARTCGLVLESVREVGLFDLQPAQRKKGSGSYLRCYTARVTLRTGLFDLVRFLNTLETTNPYLCVVSLSISPQTGDPERHNVSFDVQWPVWTDENTLTELERQLQDELSPGGIGPS